MKKIMIAASCVAFFTACSSNTNSEYDKYYEGNQSNTASAADETDSAATTRMTATTRQSEVDTNRMNIGTDRSADAAPATGTAATTAGTTAAATTNRTTTTGDGTTTGGTTTAAGQSGTTSAKTQASTSGATALQGNFEKGQKLIEMSDCLACHNIDQKLVGPSYKEVADKYEMNDKNVTYLAQKIIKGGSGVWGQIPMSPHPDLSEGDAKEMAKYVLSLKSK